MREIYFHGYTIREDGVVLSQFGRPLKMRWHNNHYEFRLKVGDERKSFIVARLIYNAFHPFGMSDRNLCVIHKDGDNRNLHLDNLALVERKDLIHGDKHVRSLLSNAQAEEVRALYAAGGVSMGQLAKRYEVSKSTIQSLIERRHRDYYKL